MGIELNGPWWAWLLIGLLMVPTFIIIQGAIAEAFVAGARKVWGIKIDQLAEERAKQLVNDVLSEAAQWPEQPEGPPATITPIRPRTDDHGE